MFKKLFIMFASVAVLASCSDKIYEDINTDKTKPTQGVPAAQLTFAELTTYGSIAMAETHRAYPTAFAQYFMGEYNNTYYGGQQRPMNAKMKTYWEFLYGNAVRDLTDAIQSTKDDPKKVNLNAALRIYRVYIMSLLTDIYGDVPYFEAGMGYYSGQFTPKFDEQKDIYYDFFKELKEAAAKFTSSADVESITSDVIYGGNINKWKAFANSLRLRFAMRLSAVDEEKGKAEFAEALAADGGLIETPDLDALIHYMKIGYSFSDDDYKDYRGNAFAKVLFGDNPKENQITICSTFYNALQNSNDPRFTMLCHYYVEYYLDVATTEGRIDITDAMLTSPENIRLIEPGDFWYAPYPSSINILPGTKLYNRMEEIKADHPDFDPLSGSVKTGWTQPKITHNFLRSDNPGVVITSAEVNLLRAEAAARGWTGDNAAAYYEKGIRAAIAFLSDNFGFEPVSEDTIKAYLAQPEITYNASNAICQINTQAWILHMLNPLEGWANLRRSNYPQLPEPTGAHNDVYDKGSIPVRLLYPLDEASYNSANYEEAISRIPGEYNWRAPMWWDK